jgi:glycosyltransferase involved in cell wall biosynthesis
LKRLAIVIKNLKMGGSEKALVSMLKEIPEGKLHITLYVLAVDGELLGEVPNWVQIKLIPYGTARMVDIITGYLRSGKLIKAVHSTVLSIQMRSKDYYEQYLYKALMLPKIEDEFDVAISYFFPCGFTDWYTLHNVRAKKRFVWVHSDISKFPNIHHSACIEMYSSYDRIFCVSEESRRSFIKTLPEVSNNVDVMYNFISSEEIVTKAEEELGFDDGFEGFRIVTVGRLSKEKGQDLIPGVLKRLLVEGYNVRWYCVGEGKLRSYLEQRTVKMGLEERLVLLGNQANPYPYVKNCDIYVQPSRIEAYSLAIAEARCLRKPIVSTFTNGSVEQIKDEVTGFLVPIDEGALYSKIKILLENEEIRNRFINQTDMRGLEVTDEKLETLYAHILS